MRVLAFDCGMRTGYGVREGQSALSGSRPLDGGSLKIGDAFRSLRKVASELIAEHKPDVVAVAQPFIGKHATPIEMRVIIGLECRLQEIVEDAGIEYERVHEPDARRAFLYPQPVPRKSPDIKAAIIARCRLLQWPVKDNHASDALCVADFVYSQRKPTQSHMSTPLFLNVPALIPRRHRARSA